MFNRKTRCLALMTLGFMLISTAAAAAPEPTLTWGSKFVWWKPDVKDTVVLMPFLNTELKDVNPLLIKVVHLTANWVIDAAIVFYSRDRTTIPVSISPETEWERKVIDVDGENYGPATNQLLQILNGLEPRQAVAAKITINAVGRYQDHTEKVRAAILWPK